MKDRYIVIQQWMISELKLKSSELIAFALIHGLTIHQSDFHGSAEYLSTWLGIHPKRCYHVLGSLCEKGYIKRLDDDRPRYISLLVENESQVKGNERLLNSNDTAHNCVNRSNKTLPNNIIDNIENIDNNRDNIENIASGELFAPETIQQTEKVKRPRKTTENLCLFENSRYYDYEEFIKEFQQPEFRDINIVHYYHVVADWSASKGAKRRDWISQTRNIIRSDMEKGKLHKITAGSDTLSPEALQYLKDMAD